jgi:hypothetical protein
MSDDELEIATEDAKSLISKGVTAFLEADNPDQVGLYVTGWVLTAEWTSVEAAQSNVGGIASVNPSGQSPSMSRGLAEFGAEAYSLFNGDEEDE